MEDVLGKIIAYAAPLVVTLVGVMISVAINRFTTYIRTKTMNKSVEFAIDMLSHTTDTVVAALTQTVAADAKKASEDGKLSPDEAKRIKDTAISEILKIVNKDVVSIIEAHVGDFDKFISNKIEQAVIKLKA